MPEKKDTNRETPTLDPKDREILSELARHPASGLTADDVARAVILSKTVALGHLAVLEQNKYVERRVAGADVRYLALKTQEPAPKE